MEEDFVLPEGSHLLQGQYEILGHLAEGGFGITYIARDSLERLVVVKECFPYELCYRDGQIVKPRISALKETYRNIITNFVAEARRLAKLKHPNIVAVHQVFEENNTAYMAMDYVDGQELLDVRDLTPRRLTPRLMKKTLRDTLDAVAYLHSVGVLHRDISPDNLLLDANDNVVLIDFGAAYEGSRQAGGGQPGMLAVKDGYSPHEFYGADMPHGPASDLYSLGATYYRLVTGEAPPDAMTRHADLCKGWPDPYKPLLDGAWEYDQRFLSLIDQALCVDPAQRVQSARDWLKELDRTRAVPAPRMEKTRIPRTRVRTAFAIGQPQLPPEELAKAIAQMVQAANSDVEASVSAQVTEPAIEETVVENRPVTRTPVDIFGNPVENVDDWMKEQDRLISSRKKKQAAQELAERQARNAKKTRKSLLLRLLTGDSDRRRPQAPVAWN